MFILTDGKNYVMENPIKIGEYISTTSSSMAKEFTYKQARSLVQNSRKKYAWIKKYRLIDVSTGNESNKSLYYKGNANLYIDDNFEFDYSILNKIEMESQALLGLAGWDEAQLFTYKDMLNKQLSKCDCAESDIKHALEKYKDEHGGKKPQAHKAAKITYMLDDIRDLHKRTKQCLKFVQVMLDAVTQHWSIEKIKIELEKSKYTEYKGRTEYWELANDILGD